MTDHILRTTGAAATTSNTTTATTYTFMVTMMDGTQHGYFYCTAQNALEARTMTLTNERARQARGLPPRDILEVKPV